MKLLPPNSLKMAVNGLRTMFTSVFSRPRCGMPITTSVAPPAAATSIMACNAGIVTSPPSSPKRFVPTKRFWQNASNPSASVNCCRIARFASTSIPLTQGAASIRRWIQFFWSGSWMCMNSTPIGPQ